jgi:hypothetical protein
MSAADFLIVFFVAYGVGAFFRDLYRDLSKP